MKILIAEDDPTSRKLMQHILSPYGQCDLAVNGKEAIKVFLKALDYGPRYDLVCLDIMMPEIDGQDVLKKIRQVEEDRGISSFACAKVIMTTALSNGENVLEAYRSKCEAYLVKPVDKQKLLEELQTLGLV